MNARDEGTEDGTDAMEMKNTLAFQRFVGMIWRRVRPPYWHSRGDAAELSYRKKQRKLVLELRAFAAEFRSFGEVIAPRVIQAPVAANDFPQNGDANPGRTAVWFGDRCLGTVLLRPIEECPKSMAFLGAITQWVDAAKGAQCHRAPPAGIPEALAAALADGLIPDSVPVSAGLEAHLKSWVRREMALLTAGVGIKHREKFNP